MHEEAVRRRRRRRRRSEEDEEGTCGKKENENPTLKGVGKNNRNKALPANFARSP